MESRSIDDYQQPKSQFPDKEIRQTRWWSQKGPYVLAIGCICGLGTGIAHHFYYASLDGKRVENQAWVIRSGTAIAFLAKLLFSTSIGVAFPQQAWKTVRSKFLRLETIDSLFMLRTEIWGFLNSEILLQAKLATLLALASWAMVLLPIIAPASISVRSSLVFGSPNAVQIQTLNFSRSPLSVDYNGTERAYTLPLADLQRSGSTWDNYIKASRPAVSLIYSAVYGKSIVDPPSPCGANCTFSQTFTAPAYKCQDVDYTQQTVADPKNPFCSLYSDRGEGCSTVFNQISSDAFNRPWYRARNSTGDPCDELPESISCSVIEGWSEGKIWMMYQHLLPEYKKMQTSDGYNSTPIPDSAWEKGMFVCQSYNATYNLKRQYSNNIHTVTGTLSYLNPVNFSAIHSSASRSTIYSAYAAFAIHQTLYNILEGYIAPSGRGAETDTTGIGATGLVDPEPFPRHAKSVFYNTSPQKPVKGLREVVEQLHFNATVSMLALAPDLVYADVQSVPATTQATHNVWVYNWVFLVGAYAIAAFLDIFAVLTGIVAMRKNRVCLDFGFLRVATTTRKLGSLARLFHGWEQGEDPVPDSVKKERVMFGHVHDSDGSAGMGFGVKGEVVKLKQI